MLDDRPHPLIAEAARCSGVCMKLVTALRLKTPAEARVLRGRAGERVVSENEPRDTEMDGLIPGLPGGRLN